MSDDRQFGEGQDNYLQGIRSAAEAAKQAGSAAGSVGTAAGEATANAAAATVQAGMETGKAASEIAVGTAAGGPWGAVLSAAWSLRHTLFKVLVFLCLFLLFIIITVVSLPSIVFNNIFHTDPTTVDPNGPTEMTAIFDDLSATVADCIQAGYDAALAEVDEIIADGGYDYDLSMEALVNNALVSMDYDTCYILAAYSASMGQRGTTKADLQSMLNEGIHIKDVDGVVMLRPTISPIVYLQQIGRCLACSSDGSTSPVIFDLVNNYESARVEESGQRVFNIEFSHHPSSGKGKNTPIPFYMSGVPTQFEAILEKFDHLFTRAGRWDFCYSILQEFYHEYGQYPHSRTCYRGIKIGRWLSEQILYIQHNSLSVARKERLEMLPGWSTFLIERQPTRRTFDDYYKELLVYFEREGHIDIPQSYINPSTGCKLGLYLTRLRNIRKKTDRGHLSQDQINRLNALGMKWVKREHPYRDFDYYYQQLIKFYRREGHIKVPTRFIDPDTGCHLGNFINCVRQAKRGTGHDIVLTDRQIEMLNDLGMVWQVQASPLPFDTYYEELLRYYRREGHIRVPGNYIVPENGCKLGKFIQRMRAIRAGTASSGFITQEQIAKLDAMGMVWNASNSKKNLEERSCRNGYFHLVDSGGDRTQQADCGDQQNTS